MSRDIQIVVRVDAEELAQLDRLRSGESRAGFLRRRGLGGESEPEAQDVASPEEALALLTKQARDGKVASTIALARLLAVETKPAPSATEDPFDAAAERRLKLVQGG